MNIIFKPMFWPSIFSFFVFVMLLSFGTWQVKRLYWKEALIERYLEQSQSNPVVNPSDLKTNNINEFKSIQFKGNFLHENEIYITGKTYEGNAGFHVVTPLILDDGRVILINRGWVSEDYRDPAKRAFSLIDGRVSVAGILRRPGVKGYFVPENDPQNGFWFTLVPSQINRHLGLGDTAIDQFYADALRTSDVVTLPIAAKTKLNLRNAHLSYAITWYGIALSLIGVYLAFHYQAGRLQFGRWKVG